MPATEIYDIIVLGASGFTGSLVVEYLAQNGPRTLKWAVAGRSRSKLEGMLARVGERVALDLSDTRTFVVDTRNDATVLEMVSHAKVILTTVGPYAWYGESVVAQCARNGVDYVDLTGESNWARKMIDKYDAVAKKNGAAIVHHCGFDSIPFDITVLLAVEELRRLADDDAVRVHGVRCYTETLSGGVSGGTVASLVGVVEDPHTSFADIADPHYLVDTADVAYRAHKDERDLAWVQWDDW